MQLRYDSENDLPLKLLISYNISNRNGGSVITGYQHSNNWFDSLFSIQRFNKDRYRIFIGITVVGLFFLFMKKNALCM